MRKKSIVNDNAKSTTSSAYQRGNNRDGSPHYVFLYSDDDDNDDADDDDDGGDDDCDNSHGKNYTEKIPLQIRKNRGEKNFYPRKVEVITVTLKAEDTLQALSLRYRCTISELKRINNIHKENEIFARRTVKVPVQPYSIFTEINKYDNEEEQNEITNNTVEFFDVNNSIVDDKINNDEQQNIIIPSSTGNSNSNNSDNNDNNNINNIILNSLSIDPLRNNIENNDFEIDTSENDGLLLINERDRDSTPEGRIIELFGCSGADWGLTWIHLLGASFLFGFVLPVIYIVFITENQHKYTNNTNSI